MKRIGDNRLEHGAKGILSCGQEFFRNGARREKCTQFEEFARSRIRLLYFLQGQRECDRDRFWMINPRPSTFLEQSTTLGLIQGHIARKPTPGLFHIGTGLIKSKWETSHHQRYS